MEPSLKSRPMLKRIHAPLRYRDPILCTRLHYSLYSSEYLCSTYCTCRDDGNGGAPPAPLLPCRRVRAGRPGLAAPESLSVLKPRGARRRRQVLPLPLPMPRGRNCLSPPEGGAVYCTSHKGKTIMGNPPAAVLASGSSRRQSKPEKAITFKYVPSDSHSHLY